MQTILLILSLFTFATLIEHSILIIIKCKIIFFERSQLIRLNFVIHWHFNSISWLKIAKTNESFILLIDQNWVSSLHWKSWIINSSIEPEFLFIKIKVSFILGIFFLHFHQQIFLYIKYIVDAIIKKETD